MDEGRKNIVIVGGSYAGVSTAHYVLKHAVPALPNPEAYQVVLVSAASQAMCRPACPRALIADKFFSQDKLFIDISKQFEQYANHSFHFVHGTCTELNHGKQVVGITLANGTIETLTYHSLIIATGSSTPSPLLSLNRDEHYLRQKWNDFREALPAAKTIVVAGGGPAGVETAGELGEYLNGRSGWFSSQSPEPKVKITVVTSSSHILPVLRPALAKKAEAYLAQVNVKVTTNTKVSSVEPLTAGREDVAAPATVTLHNGTVLEADLYIPATGTTPNTSFVSPSLLISDGRINTNPLTLRVGTAGPRVYAVGDCASYSRPAVHLILNAIPILGNNIKRDLLLDAGVNESAIPAERHYTEDKTETQLVPIGVSKGVGAAMGWAIPSWLVWLIKGRDYWLWTVGNLWSGKQWNKES